MSRQHRGEAPESKFCVPRYHFGWQSSYRTEFMSEVIGINDIWGFDGNEGPIWFLTPCNLVCFTSIPSFTLKMVAVCFSKTFVTTYQCTQKTIKIYVFQIPICNSMFVPPSYLLNLFPNTDRAVGSRGAAYIREGVVSNLKMKTGCLDFPRGCPQSLQEKSRMVRFLGQDCFLPNPFQFIIIPLSSYHKMRYSVKSSLNSPRKKTDSETSVTNYTYYEYTHTYIIWASSLKASSVRNKTDNRTMNYFKFYGPEFLVNDI
jgi:hypothetical protein